MKSSSAILLISLSLIFANATHADQKFSPPALQDIAPVSHPMAEVVKRFAADEASLEHVYQLSNQRPDSLYAPRRAAAQTAFYAQWSDFLKTIDQTKFGNEDHIDMRLLQRAIRIRTESLSREQQRFDEMSALLPHYSELMSLIESRLRFETIDPKAHATALQAAREAIEKLEAKMTPRDAVSPVRTPAVAFRASRALAQLRTALTDWHGFYSGYDPQFSWWVDKPFNDLSQSMERFEKLVRDKLAGASDPEAIIGDPIGRSALLSMLSDEMVPYTPEQLMTMAEAELTWCQAEMDKAAKEMGQPNWRAALEAVKSQHPQPGEQPALVTDLAFEATQFIESRQLISIPQVAKHDWRMTMLSPEYQLQAPFFLGGEDVWVAYPTNDMPQDKKLNTLRGNNRHFSRAVVHHELIPGHHLQHFMTDRYQTHRRLFASPFWGEGWALYWELRLWELEFADTPEQRMGMLFWRSHRAARILFSLGFHLEKMSPQQAIDLLVDRVGHERENATAEVRRSFQGDYGPLYQIAYLVGGWQIHALHRDLVLGGKMSEREFHDAILTGGSMPIAAVRARLMAEPAQLEKRWRFRETR